MQESNERRPVHARKQDFSQWGFSEVPQEEGEEREKRMRQRLLVEEGEGESLTDLLRVGLELHGRGRSEAHQQQRKGIAQEHRRRSGGQEAEGDGTRGDRARRRKVGREGKRRRRTKDRAFGRRGGDGEGEQEGGEEKEKGREGEEEKEREL